jgi:phospholipid transport system transporter-binding protein
VSATRVAAPAFDLTSGPFNLAAGEGGQLRAEGPLTFASARHARELGLAAIGRGGTSALTIDCRGVTAADSAGLTVLIDWLAASRAAKRSLRFAHVPQGLTALAKISEVSELLERGV